MLTVFTCLNGHRWDAPQPEGSGDGAARIVCPVCGAAAQPRDPGAGDISIPETRAPSAAEDRNSTRECQLPASTSSAGDLPSPVDITGAPAALAEYEILGELGRGGMGIVYRALDRRRGEVVALKTMQAASPEALYLFKHEFRSRAELTHPNLISLYELIAHEDQWFFTMELVEGVDLLDYVRSGPGQRDAALSRQPLTWPAQFERLRAVLGQMAGGVAALHRAGKLHRDLKPGNALVTAQGRVIVLDFGLVAELNRADAQESTDGRLVGTVSYMAPEQAACRALTPAADWYSVGVILYQALTGRLPFDGDATQILEDKQLLDPPPPNQVAPGIPEDLAALCLELLRRDPLARPSGDAILRRLGARTEGTADTAVPRAAEMLLVGRESHLAALGEAVATLQRGRTTVVLLSGPSGAGKSALARRFLDPLRASGEAVVLEGQCYEQESVPYKAFDGLIDVLSRFLARLPRLEVEPFLPRDVASLLRVFPVLQRAVSAGRDTQVPDPQELRRRGFAALRELLARLGDRRPLLLCIDDLQWGDADSAALLADLLRPPDPPVLLLLGCYRSEEATRPFLQALTELRTNTADAIDWRELTIDPLTPPQAQELAARLLGSAGAASAEAVARESGGNPLFVHELARAAQAGAAHAPGAVSLERVLWNRIEQLPKEARELLAVIATAGRPLPQAEACRAARLVADVFPTLAVLRSQRLVRGTGLGGEDMLAVYHDRVRETMGRNLTPEVIRGTHRRIAETLEATDLADPEELAVHLEGAAEPVRAGHYYALAASRAAQALAFDHAVKLYRSSRRLRPLDGEEGRTLRTRFADALANAGQCAEAAAEYSIAAANARTGEALELQRRAADQLLRSGHIDEGIATLHSVLASVGLKLPSTPRRALWGLVARRLQLWFRGLHYQQRAADAVSPEDLQRLDICWSAAMILSITDTIYGAYFQTRHLLLALQVGEPCHIVRGLALEAGHLSSKGGSGIRRAEKILQTAEELAESVAEPYAHAFILTVRAIIIGMLGGWKRCAELCTQAEEAFRSKCTGVTWELDTVNRFALQTLTHMGEVGEINRRFPIVLQEARERGNLYGETNLSSFVEPLLRLAADQPLEGRRQLQQSMRQWSRKGFHVQHLTSLRDEAQIDLYLGDAGAAWNRLKSHWAVLSKSFLLRVQQLRVYMYDIRARSAVAMASTAARPKPFLRAAERDILRLESEKLPWPDALAKLHRAGVAWVRKESSKSLALLRDAVARLEALDMHLHAAAAQRRVGELIGGDEGKAMIARSDSWMRGQPIVSPERMTAMLIPGFPDHPSRQ